MLKKGCILINYIYFILCFKRTKMRSLKFFIFEECNKCIELYLGSLDNLPVREYFNLDTSRKFSYFTFGGVSPQSK